MSTSHIVKLKNVRLSFPRLFRSRAFQEGQVPKFEATFLLDPSIKAHAKSIKEIQDTAMVVAHEKWGKKIPKSVEYCFGDAAENDKEYDGYEGMFYLSTSNTARPVVVDRQRNPVTEEDNIVYAGCYVNTNVTFWTMDNPAHPEYGKKVCCNLRIVQFVKDGDAFGMAAANAEEELDELDDADEEDYLD